MIYKISKTHTGFCCSGGIYNLLFCYTLNLTTLKLGIYTNTLSFKLVKCTYIANAFIFTLWMWSNEDRPHLLVACYSLGIRLAKMHHKIRFDQGLDNAYFGCSNVEKIVLMIMNVG